MKINYKAEVKKIHPDAECYDYWGQHYYAVFATIWDKKVKLGEDKIKKYAWRNAYEKLTS